MLVFEFKTSGKPNQFAAIDDAIRTCQFIRNKSIRDWIDNPKASKYDLNKQCAVLAKEFPFADELNSMARQSAAERAWSATGNTIGLDVGIKSFYTDSNGIEVENPKFYRASEVKMKRAQRLVSRQVKGSINRRKSRTLLGRIHLKISRQRSDRAVKLARCVITSNDVVVYEDLRIKNMVKNHCLAKSISDAGWYQFRVWLETFGRIFGRITIAVNPADTSQECSSCGVVVKKSLSTRTHACQCGCVLDRDHNAALNILTKGLSTVGHTGRSTLDVGNALGDSSSTFAGANLLEQDGSLIKESQCL